MYHSVYFETLQLHANHDSDSHTLSKTTAVYKSDFYVFHPDNFYESSKGIKKAVKEAGLKIKGSNSELYLRFEWHLN